MCAERPVDVLAPFYSGLSLSASLSQVSPGGYLFFTLLMTHCPEGQVLQALFYKQGNRGPEKLGHTAPGGKGVPTPKGSPNGHVLHPLLTCHPNALW